MSFTERTARYRRLRDEHAAWGLLRANNAHIVLGFIGELFEKRSDIPIGEARAALEAHLSMMRATGMDTETPAATYLRQWIADGYLREQDQILMMTDACLQALRFAESLQKREMSATASHLRVVMDALEGLVLDLSPNIEERMRILEARKADLDRELEDLKQGRVRKLSEAEQRERITEVHRLAADLTGDFRHLEDELRRRDQEVRQTMIDSVGGRGGVLEEIMDSEDALSQTPAGQAFDGFYNVLLNENRRQEFRGLLQRLTQMPVIRHLDEKEARFLANLVAELMTESRRVLERRKRAGESLAAYVRSGAQRENLAVDQALADVARAAVAVKDQGLRFFHPMNLWLNIARATATSVDALRLTEPGDAVFVNDLEEHEPGKEVSETHVEQMYSLDKHALAERWREELAANGPATIAQVAGDLPITQGLEALVTLILVARATNATELEGTEQVYFSRVGKGLARATIPRLLLNAADFPMDIRDLNL